MIFKELSSRNSTNAPEGRKLITFSQEWTNSMTILTLKMLGLVNIAVVANRLARNSQVTNIILVEVTNNHRIRATEAILRVIINQR